MIAAVTLRSPPDVTSSGPGAALAAAGPYVNPAVAAVLGVVVLGENLTPGVVLGFALVLADSAPATGVRKPNRALDASSEPV